MAESDLQSTEADLSQAESDLQSTEADLSQAESDLQSTQQALAETQQELNFAALARVQDVQRDKWLSVAPMWALLLLPLLIIVAYICWFIWRRKAVSALHQASPEVVEEQPVNLDPVADDSNPSVPLDGLGQNYQTMHGGMPEQSFIEELLQQHKHEDQPMGASSEHQQQQGQVRLSEDIEALLNGQTQTHNQADEPVVYLSHEEEMNTKLDLALSYRDMGELVQAKSVLEAVVRQGDAQQVAQAKALLSSINHA